MRTITLSTRLDAPAHVVLDGARTPAVFRFVVRGLLSMPDLDAREAPFVAGEEITSRLRLLGVVPFSRHHLRVVELDLDGGLLRTHERGGLLRTWDHDVVVEPIDERTCRYTDTVRLDAGALTPLVAAAARGFYRIRQRRWRALAPVLAATR